MLDGADQAMVVDPVPRQHLWPRLEVVISGEIGSRRSDSNWEFRHVSPTQHSLL